MERPPPLNLIQVGSEWIATNGTLTPDGTIHFPEVDAAEEVFVSTEAPRVNAASSQPSTPPSES